MSISDFLSLAFNGVSIGSIYAMAGVGLNIAYRPTNVFNLAHGCLIALGMMFAWEFMSGLALPWVAGVALTISAVGLLGLVEERVAVASLVRRAARAPANAHGWIITTLAVSIILENLADRIWGSDPRALPPIPGTSLDTLEFLSVTFTTHQVVAILLTIASIAVIERFYQRTRLGHAVLAVAEDRDGARLCGISPAIMTMGSFTVGAGYAAFGGILAAPFTLASPTVGLDMLIKGFMALAIGGVGSNWGAFAGGLLIATIESLCSAYATPGVRQLILLVALLTILLARPNGLFGQARLREV